MTADFDRDIEDPTRPIAVDLRYPGEPLLFAFGGIAGKMAAFPPFEFFRLTQQLQVNKAYIRDLDRSWYHAGLKGITQDIDGTVDYLQGIVHESGTDRLVVFGSSMGGYAALLFGALLNAEATHSFSPHTSLTHYRNVRNRDELKAVPEGYSSRYFDLNDFMNPSQVSGSGDVHIYYDATNRKDRKHITHLDDDLDLNLHPFPGGGHNLVKYLKAAGELERVVEASLDGIPYSPRTDIRLRRSLLDRLLGKKVR